MCWQTSRLEKAPIPSGDMTVGIEKQSKLPPTSKESGRRLLVDAWNARTKKPILSSSESGAQEEQDV